MVECPGTPGHRCMTILTRFIGRNMVGRLADRIHIVMAGFTTTGNTGVIEAYAGPVGIGYMTVITGCIGLYVIGRFACGSNTVMAALTSTGDHRVIEANL